MNLKQIQALSDEELQIKVAWLRGWNRCEPYGNNAMRGKRQGEPNSAPWRDIPDYCNDLNAMHKAEAMFSAWFTGTHPNDEDFLKLLIKIVSTEGKHRMAHNATARQRAEAFVLTMEEIA